MKKLNTILIALIISCTATVSICADRYAVANGNWNSISTWSATDGGTPGASVPIADDNVYIFQTGADRTVTIPDGYSAACSNLYVGATTNRLDYSLDFATSSSGLSVSDNVILYSPSNAADRSLKVNTGTLLINGNLGLSNGLNSGHFLRICNVTITTGVVSVLGDLIFNTLSFSDPRQNQIIMSGGAGTFNLGGTFTMNDNIGTLTPGTTSTFNFNGTAAQTIPIGVSSVIYNNINVNNTSGSGATLSAAITSTNVTGNLQVQTGILNNGGFANTLASNKNFSVSNGATFNLTGTSGMVTVSGTGTKTFGPTSTISYSGTTQNISDDNYGKLILSGGTKTALASFSIKDDFTNNASSFVAGSNTITLDGSSAIQNLGGSSATTFYNLIFNNSLGFQLLQNQSVSNILTMSSGNITTNANTLTLGTSTTVRGTLSRTSGTIIGNFRRWFTNTTSSNILFPIGTASNYRPANIGFTSAPSAGGTLTAFFTATDPGNAGLPQDDGGTSIDNVGKEGYWTLNAADGLTGGTYSLDLTADGFTGVSVVATLRIIKRTTGGGDWTINGSHSAGTGTVGVPIVHRTAMSGFSEFGVGGASDNPLPVELSSFSALVVGSIIKLTWATATEVNNYGFEILRQAQDDEWDLLGFVEGHGNSNSPKEYNFIDSEVNSAGIYSYRLKQIDNDGKFEYSKVIEVDLGSPMNYELSQNYPNPFNPSTTIRFSVSESSFINLSIFNSLGEKIEELVNEVKEPGVHTIEFFAQNLPSGTYFYTIKSNDFANTKKMILVK